MGIQIPDESGGSMASPQKKQVSIEEFYGARVATDQLLEYIDGVVYMAPSPWTRHQRISMRLGSTLFEFLQGEP